MDLGRYLFTIAVVADTHMNEVEYGSSSPYECNRIANARTRYVVERLNQIDPALTIHLGDLIHPVPGMPTYAQAAGNFKALTAGLRSPLRLVPGNHDVGDKPVAWAPAGIVNDEALAQWREHFGDHYYAFDFRGLHIVVVDAQIVNSGLRAEAEQRAWLERDLAAHAGQRTFLCLHYPPYVSEPAEAESYDNIAEPGRAWLLGLIERHRPEAVFCGHVHNFWYNRHGASDCYILPSTAFVRQDYSELARVAPADGQHGRDEVAKLGFFVVRVHERGHVCHVERTHGAGLDPGQALPPAPVRVRPLHTVENRRAPLGVDLRHPWTEVIEIPPMGALDEFERKRARNDYPLMALWEMGVRKLRVPFQDLESERTRARMRELRRLGHAFTVYTLDVPRGRARDLLLEHHELVDAWEVVCHWPEVERTLEAVAAVRAKAPLAALLSKLRTKEDVRREGSRYFHFINHGFLPEECPDLAAFRASVAASSAVDGFVFRVVRQASPWTAIAAVQAAGGGGARASVHVRMTSTNPAEAFTDDGANANRVAEALAAAVCAQGGAGGAIDVFVDTFSDIDRGYFVRNGLVDRRYDPRLGSHVVRHLYAALNEGLPDGEPAPLVAGARVELPDGHACLMTRGREALALVLPDRKLLVDRLPGADRLGGSGGQARWIDLATGEVTLLGWRAADGAVEIPGGRACASPVLIAFAP